MENTIEDFYGDLTSELLASSESITLLNFMEFTSSELIESGIIEGIEIYQYYTEKGAKKPKRVDGFFLNEDGVLDLFIADISNSKELENLTNSDIQNLFKRLNNYLEYCFSEHDQNEESQLKNLVFSHKKTISKINCYILSNKQLSKTAISIPSSEFDGISVYFHIWDLSRFYRQAISTSQKEALTINFEDFTTRKILCLPAHFSIESLESFLIVMPGEVLSSLYDKYGTRLLEQNVRCFLQARGNVNKGIRDTIINRPEMFFSYNNGITATAKSIKTEITQEGIQISCLEDLQIVNGGQTTASLFHTARKDKVSLEKVFVQMKLTIVQEDESATLIPKISEYANTQNRVNAADFFSNHPFHIRMEELSRRIYAPLKKDELRETRWFYERARGQYNDAMSKLTIGDTKRFKVENPKSQMFTKTDMAKYLNVWDEEPKWVNKGAQGNFTQFAKRISQEWKVSSNEFNELFYKRLVAKAIIFKATEKIISGEAWYGGYRANIVAYTLAALSEYCKSHGKTLDFDTIWLKQDISIKLVMVIKSIAFYVNEKLMTPPPQFKNITEWAKKDLCWDSIKRDLPENLNKVETLLSTLVVNLESDNFAKKAAKSDQIIDNSIDAQRKVLEYGKENWKPLAADALKNELLSAKEMSILTKTIFADKIPSGAQAKVLLNILDRVDS
ncbi:AIPR family protein [Aliiglaciecola litoralis]|uniref:AIPR family protein n=1 Tax=Aliiglaciecola litoralis TaxID=582857 RepID=A0ABN1LHW3_9ALTE